MQTLCWRIDPSAGFATSEPCTKANSAELASNSRPEWTRLSKLNSHLAANGCGRFSVSSLVDFIPDLDVRGEFAVDEKIGRQIKQTSV